jgi:C1A family cysteine protease
MEKSASQRVSQGGGSGGRISLRASNPYITDKVRQVLKDYDVNQDETLDVHEVSALVEHLLKKEMKYTYLKYAFGGMTLFAFLLLGSMFGLTWAVVDSLKDTQVGTNGAMMTKDGSKVVQVASSEYAVVNGSLLARGEDSQWPIRTNTYVGAQYSLFHDISMKSLLEMNVLNIRLSDGSEASFRVHGATKGADGSTRILTQEGVVTLLQNGSLSLDRQMDNYLQAAFSEPGSGRRRLFSSSNTEISGFFGTMEDDGSWWRVEASSKSQAKLRSGRLRDAANRGGGTSEFAKAWANYKSEYGKRFDRDTDQVRFDNFKANMLEVLRVNEDDTLDWWASGNEYSDMSWREFASTYMMQYAPDFGSLPTTPMMDDEDASESRRHLLQTSSVDWRLSGKVAPVRNQGGCGGCWAFAAASVLESAHAILKGLSVPVDLSEQHLINCVTSNSNGCVSGSTWDAIRWAIGNNITYESRYPFTGVKGSCENVNYPASDIVKFKGFVGTVSANSATSLRAAVAKQPVATYMMVDSSFMNYAGGVYSSTTCTLSVNHAMVLVGYDTSAPAAPYWTIRNSWGANWGEAGYARVAMKGDGTPGMCGMYQYNFFPPMALATPATPSPPPSSSSTSSTSPPPPPKKKTG